MSILNFSPTLPLQRFSPMLPATLNPKHSACPPVNVEFPSFTARPTKKFRHLSRACPIRACKRYHSAYKLLAERNGKIRRDLKCSDFRTSVGNQYSDFRGVVGKHHKSNVCRVTLFFDEQLAVELSYPVGTKFTTVELDIHKLVKPEFYVFMLNDLAMDKHLNVPDTESLRFSDFGHMIPNAYFEVYRPLDHAVVKLLKLVEDYKRD